MAIVGIELETLVSEPDALATLPPMDVRNAKSTCKPVALATRLTSNKIASCLYTISNRATSKAKSLYHQNVVITIELY